MTNINETVRRNNYILKHVQDMMRSMHCEELCEPGNEYYKKAYALASFGVWNFAMADVDRWFLFEEMMGNSLNVDEFVVLEDYVTNVLDKEIFECDSITPVGEDLRPLVDVLDEVLEAYIDYVKEGVRAE